MLRANPKSRRFGRVRQIHAIVQRVFCPAGARNWLYLERVGANPGRCATAGKPADRMQQGLVPSPDPDIAPHAVLFRSPWQWAVSACADCARLDAKPAASRTNAAERIPRAGGMAGRAGIAVLVPQRPGHGATGGRYLEDQAVARRLIIPRRARHRRGAELSARSILCPAGRVRRLSGTRPTPGMRSHWPARRRKASRRSLYSRRPDGAVTPTTFRIRSARGAG